MTRKRDRLGLDGGRGWDRVRWVGYLREGFGGWFRLNLGHCSWKHICVHRVLSMEHVRDGNGRGQLAESVTTSIPSHCPVVVLLWTSIATEPSHVFFKSASSIGRVLHIPSTPRHHPVTTSIGFARSFLTNFLRASIQRLPVSRPSLQRALRPSSAFKKVCTR